MDNSLTFNDIKLLLIQKKKWIFVIMLLSSILFGATSIYRGFIDTEENTSESNEVLKETNYELNVLLNTDEELLTEDELDFVENTLLEGAYSFRIYIEHQDGSVYDRSNLLNELLLSNDVIEEIEGETSVEIDRLKPYFLNVDLNSSNVIYTVTIGLGDQQANEAVSKAYYEALQNGEIDIISNKVTKLFDAPELVELEEIDEEPMQNEENHGSIIDVILPILLGAVFGIGFGIFIAFLIAFLEKKVNPVFNYKLTEHDMFTNFSHVKMSSQERYDSMIHSILYPTTNKKLVVSQDTNLNKRINKSLKNELNDYSVATNNVSDIEPGLNFDELIIITENQLTEKNWYKKQKNQLRTYGKPLEVIKLK